MNSIFLILAIFTAEPYDIEYIKFNENPIEVTIYVDSTHGDEALFKALLEKKSSFELTNPAVIPILGEEAIKQNCNLIDKRLAGIRKNFKLKIEDRYLIRAPYGISIGSKNYKFRQNMELEFALQMLEYYLDSHYYDKEMELRDSLFEAVRHKEIIADYNARISFVQLLFYRNFKIDGTIPPLATDNDEGENVEMVPVEYPPNGLYVQIFDADGKLKTIEELGYKPKPMPHFHRRPTHPFPFTNKREDE